MEDGVLARQCQTKQHKMKTISLALISVLACIFSLIAAAQSRPAADLIITNAKVWTVDKSNPAAQAVAVLGDRIVSVGSNSDVNNWRGPSTHSRSGRGNPRQRRQSNPGRFYKKPSQNLGQQRRPAAHARAACKGCETCSGSRCFAWRHQRAEHGSGLRRYRRLFRTAATR